MNSYSLALVVCGSIIAISQLTFIILFHPSWKDRRKWWMNIALYSQALGYGALGIRTAVIYLDRLYAPSVLTGSAQIVSLSIAAFATFGSVTFIVGYLRNRNRKKGKPSRRSDDPKL